MQSSLLFSNIVFFCLFVVWDKPILLLIPTIDALVVPFISSRKGIQTTRTTTYTRLYSNNDDNNNNNVWQSHVSTHPDTLKAWNKLFQDISVTSLDEMDIAFLCVGQAHATHFPTLVEQAYCQLQDKNIKLISILGGGVIGDNVELDQPTRPSMSILIGALPKYDQDADIASAEIKVIEYNNGSNNDDEIDVNDEEKFRQSLHLEERFKSCLVFCDPWCPIENILAEYIQAPDRVLAGGISCPALADQSSLAIDHRTLPQGSMIGIAFAGSLGLQTMVAQGCRPLGSIYKISKCDGNVIQELDGKPAVQVLQQFANTAPPEEQKQISSGLLCGIAARSTNAASSHFNNKSSDDTDDEDEEANDEEQSIDFLSRQIIGFVPSVNGIAVGTSQMEPGDLFCFQVRDGTTAEQDLQLMTQRAKTARLFDNADVSSICNNSSKKSRPVAALQISCVARGRGMFGGTPNVDLSNIQQLIDNNKQAVSGFFANGEIGPVGLAGFSTTRKTDGKSFLHSFTTVAAILCEYDTNDEKATISSSGSRQEEGSLDAWA